MIDIKLITNGGLDGHRIWVCDLRFDEYGGWGKKPIRNVKPTLVQIAPNIDRDTFKDVSGNYHWPISHILAIGKNGKPMKSKRIPLFDTTGHRGPGVFINCFWDKIDCEAHYAQQVDAAVWGLENYKKEVLNRIDNRISSIKDWS